MKKKIIIIAASCLIVIGVAIATIIFVNRDNDEDNKVDSSSETTPNASASASPDTTQTTNSGEETTMKEAAEKQFAMPEKGEQVAVFTIKDYGQIKVKFFPNVAPKAVENFVTHAKNGYYNGVTFHRVINEFMIQGGDPKGNGTGGESIWGEGFEEEIDLSLVPWRGSLCMASAGTGTSSLGSQFFITQAKYSDTIATSLRQGGWPSDILSEYKQRGGYLPLYTQYTVFGQVFEGIEVVDKIAATETNEADKPLKDVVIEKIDVIEY